MNTPTEAQLNDPKWWDENALDGATHFIDPTGTEYDDGKGGEFCEQMESGAYWILPDRQRFWPDSQGLLCVERPTKPEPQEWDGEGWPPIGCECERKDGSGVFVRTKILAMTDRFIWLSDEGRKPETYTTRSAGPFRPLRTPEERERQEAIDTAKGVLKVALTVNQLDDDTERGLEALYDAGMLRKAGGE